MYNSTLLFCSKGSSAGGDAKAVIKPLVSGAFKEGVELPPDAIVIRGGIGDPQRFITNQLDDKNLYISANGGMNVPESKIAQGIKNNQVQVTTVGDLNKAGYKVVASPSGNGNIYHVDIITPGGKELTDAQAENLSKIFGTPKKNPAKIK